MHALKKYIYTVCLTLLFLMVYPTNSNAFIGDVMSAVKEATLQIQRAAKAMKWLEITREVVSYPNEYIREVNRITDDIDAIKRTAAGAQLSVADMDKFLNLAQQYGQALQKSLSEFQGIINIVTETLSAITTGGADTVNIEQLFNDVKKQHKANMQSLAGARRVVNNTKALLASCHAANKVVNSTKKLK